MTTDCEDGGGAAPASVSIRPTRVESGEILVRIPGHRKEAGRNVRSEYGAWKGGKEGLYASTVSVSRVPESEGRDGDWERGEPWPIGDKEERF